MVMAVRGDTFRSDIAIDDVKLMPNPCSDWFIARSGQFYFQYGTWIIFEHLCSRQICSHFCTSLYKIFIFSYCLDFPNLYLLFCVDLLFFSCRFWSNLHFHVLNIFMLLDFSRCKCLIKKSVLIKMVYSIIKLSFYSYTDFPL